MDFEYIIYEKAINMGQEIGLRVGLAYEALAEALLFTSKDREEGMRAFFEKRDPRFTGEQDPATKGMARTDP